MRLVQIAQHATDLDRAEAFYAALLRQPPVAVFDPPGLVFFDVGGTRLLLDRAAPTALHYLSVDNIDTAVQRCRELGARVESEAHVIFRHESDTLGPAGAEEWQAFIRDSEGNLVGLVEQRADS